jgi:hypothetical protein
MLTSGCATLTNGGTQTVTVDADPSGAMCTLTCDAKLAAIEQRRAAARISGRE